MSDVEPQKSSPAPTPPVHRRGEAARAPEGSGNATEFNLARTLVLAASGEQTAWAQLVALYGRRIYALARSRRLSHDSSEEIAQSVFATIAAKLTSPDSTGYREQGRFESWLFRIAMNRVRDELRRARRHAIPTDPLQFADIVQTQASATSELDPISREDLRAAIDQLSDSDREVIELRHHAGLDFRRIADILAQPLGTVLARHHRALRKLKDLIGPDSHGSTT